MITFVYAKCKDELRKPLWDRFIHLSTMKIPWCTMGDFNMITSINEKKGGIPYNMNKSFDDKQEHTIKYFKFLNLWVDNESFMNTVQNCWSKREYGDIFATVKEFEEKVKNAEIEVL
ncbi:hypothetical protein H5410_046523 [Solanum commersonii]|uniref:Uncharacterized protein n=1 Tax=Solanum commersonii TaxID=4109 RepID=A0A9J5XCH0_SOLCO|nr:hypothetical protein H5410_046523 [Solanum commersonii]